MKFIQTYLPFYKRNLKVAIPVIITQVGQVIVQITDNVMVGHLGAEELAGVSFANAVFMIGIVFLIGFTQGLTMHIGQNFGKGRYDKIAAFLTNSTLLNFIVSLLLTAIMIGVGFCLKYMGQEEIVLKYANDYFFIIIATIIPAAMFFSIRFFSEGVGNTKNAMMITVWINVLNIFLNWGLIYGKCGLPALGVQGAALATLICRVLGTISFAVVLLRSNVYRPFVSLVSRPFFRKNEFIAVLKTSIPISFQTLCESFAFSGAAIMVGWLGAKELAAHQIVQNLSHVSFMAALGIGAACTIRVSHQYGGGYFHEMRMAASASVHMSVALMFSIGLIFFLGRNFIPYIYTTDTEVIKIASGTIVFMWAFQIFDAIQLSSISALRGIKDVNIPMIYSTVAYLFVCLPTGYLLSHVVGLGIHGVWLGLMAGLAFCAILFYLRFNKLSKKMLQG